LIALGSIVSLPARASAATVPGSSQRTPSQRLNRPPARAPSVRSSHGGGETWPDPYSRGTPPLFAFLGLAPSPGGGLQPASGTPMSAAGPGPACRGSPTGSIEQTLPVRGRPGTLNSRWNPGGEGILIRPVAQEEFRVKT
jgi:hypothetical protein